MKIEYYFFLIVLQFFTSATAKAQLDWTEVEIPMSDNFTLEGDIYLPSNWNSGPVILIQTPYNKNLYHFSLPIGIGQNQDEMEYAIVIVDWRGFWGSADAAYAGSPTGGEDGFACVQWIAEQSWCDGNVGTWGPSALGKIQFQTASQNPPNLRCIAPLVAGPQFNYDEYYTGGSLRTEFVEQLDNLGFGLSPVIIGNPYDNFIWNVAESINYYPETISVPALMLGGWYDHNVEVMLDFFEGLQNESPTEVQDKHRLVMGPWGHGGNGTATMGGVVQGELEYPNAGGWSDSLVWLFFDHYLKNIDNGWDDTPPVQYYQMGTNEWNSSPSWPTADTQPVNLYLHNSGLLHPALPQDDTSLSFEYNPEDPSPTIGGPTLRNDLVQGPYDQSLQVENRNDILVFTSEILSTDVMMRGQAKVHLQVESTVSDTDFMIRLCDVYPDGRSMLVCDGAFRMRFLNGFTLADESFLSPGNIYSCEIEFPNTAITFLEGHRIRLDITSSNYPRFNRNMNTGGEMYPNMSGDTLVAPTIATNTVYTSSIHSSYLELPLASTFPSAIGETNTTNTFRVFPQPTSSVCTIQLSDDINLPATLRLRNAQGQILFESVINSHQLNLDLGKYPSGFYLLEMESAREKFNQMIEVQR